MATLSFKTKFPWGDQTYFIPKIWRGMIENLGMYSDYLSYVNTILNSDNEKMMEAFFPVKDINTITPKIHTIREDPHDLWKPGRKIHMAVFNRTKNRFQFAPILECKSVQRIEVIYAESNNHKPKVIIDENIFYNTLAGINKGMEKLARNDGFDSAGDFFRFFSKDFRGNIIHWTEYKY